MLHLAGRTALLCELCRSYALRQCSPHQVGRHASDVGPPPLRHDEGTHDIHGRPAAQRDVKGQAAAVVTLEPSLRCK
jgi:hypothetical protein